MIRAIAVSVATIALVAFVALTATVYRRDLPWSYRFGIMFPDDTEYPSGFRESGFREIEPGMGLQKVLDLVGPPLRVTYYQAREFVAERVVGTKSDVRGEEPDSWDEMVLVYSKPGDRYQHYYVRTIVVDRDGVVLRIGSSFYND